MLVKITDKNGQTKNATQWGPGVTHTAPGLGDLCSPRWLHAYEGLGTAVLMNPIHGNFINPRFWRAKGKVEKRDGERKFGTRKLTTIEKLTVHMPSTEDLVVCAIILTLENIDFELFPKWVMWAESYLSGKDRSIPSAYAAANAAYAAAYAANAAYAAANAAYDAYAAANAAYDAANAAAYAANAANAAADINDVACAVFGYDEDGNK